MPSSATPVQIVNPSNGVPQDTSTPTLQTTQDFSRMRFNGSGGGGDTNIVPGVAGQTIRIHSIRFMTSAAGTYDIKSGGVVLERFIMPAAGAVNYDFRGRPYYVSGPGNAVTVGYGAAGISIEGVVEYVQN